MAAELEDQRTNKTYHFPYNGWIRFLWSYCCFIPFIGRWHGKHW